MTSKLSKKIIKQLIAYLFTIVLCQSIFAQNTITIKTYQDDITSTPDVVDGPQAKPVSDVSTNNITAVIVDTSTDKIVAFKEITSSPTAISSIPNGTYNVHIVENFTGSVGDSAPTGPASFNDQMATGAAAGDNITATYPQNPIANNVQVNGNTTVSFGFTSETINYGTVSGYVRDDNNVGIGGVDVFLIRKVDNSVVQNFQTVNTVPDIADYGEYKFENVPPGEYYVLINVPEGFTVVGNDQSSDGDTDTDTTVDNKILVTVSASENDINNNFTLTVPTNANDCTKETTDVRFDWSSSPGTGNEWTKAESTDGVTKTYSLNYTDGLGNAQTLDVTVKMIDPAGTNIDNDFTCPFSGCDDQYNRYTSTNGFFGSGFLTVSQATTNTTDEVTFEFTLSKPVYVKNFSVSDIDYVSLTQYGPKVSFQDEVTITAANGSTPVPLEYTVGSNLKLVDGNTVRSKEYVTTGNGANGDSSPSYATNAVYVNSTDQVTKLIVKYRNGQDEANITGDNGKSDGHFVRLNGFNLCAVNYAAIHGQVTEDTSGDNNGDTGRSGVTIVLKNADGTLATYADGSAIPPITTSDGTTDVDGDGKIDPAGSYYIPNINGGTYNVEIITPAGYGNISDGDASPTDGGSTPSNASTTDATVPVTVDTGQREMNNDFVIQSNALPVVLESFEGVLNENFVNLIWSTVSEVNNDYFVIEYSFDGSTFTELSSIQGSGTSTSKSVYTYDHDISDYFGQTIYYKLKQVDFDGNFEYVGEIVRITLGINFLQAFPNPINPGGLLQLLGGPANQKYKVYNMIGECVDRGYLDDTGSVKITIDTYNAGIYLIKIDKGTSLKFFVL